MYTHRILICTHIHTGTSYTVSVSMPMCMCMCVSISMLVSVSVAMSVMSMSVSPCWMASLGSITGHFFLWGFQRKRCKPTVDSVFALRSFHL